MYLRAGEEYLLVFRSLCSSQHVGAATKHHIDRIALSSANTLHHQRPSPPRHNVPHKHKDQLRGRIFTIWVIIKPQLQRSCGAPVCLYFHGFTGLSRELASSRFTWLGHQWRVFLFPRGAWLRPRGDGSRRSRCLSLDVCMIDAESRAAICDDIVESRRNTRRKSNTIAVDFQLWSKGEDHCVVVARGRKL